MLQGLTIHSKSAVARARELNYVMSEVGSGSYLVEAPGGYKFHLFNTDTSGGIEESYYLHFYTFSFKSQTNRVHRSKDYGMFQSH